MGGPSRFRVEVAGTTPLRGCIPARWREAGEVTPFVFNVETTHLQRYSPNVPSLVTGYLSLVAVFLFATGYWLLAFCCKME